MQTAVEIGINAFHVSNGNLLVQNHLVEGDNKECIQETSMENSKTHNTADESKVVEMFWVDARMRVDLKGVVIVRGVLEQTKRSCYDISSESQTVINRCLPVEGIEHFVG